MPFFGRKPAPSGFKDPNLHLAVLEAAWDAKLLPVFDKDVFYRDVLGETWDANRDGEKVDERTRSALLAIPLPPDVLARIETLEWGGGEATQHFVFHSWDGEDETFDVTDLTGIGACANLRQLSLDVAALTDIAPLRELPKLEWFRLNYGGNSVVLEHQGRVSVTEGPAEGELQDLRPLLELKALARLDIGSRYRNDDRNRGVLQELRKRGVQLETREEFAARRVAEAGAGSRKREIEKGMKAFQEKRYADAVRELESHAAHLEGSELKKLELARKLAAKQA
jgi:hypothetical protein